MKKRRLGATDLGISPLGLGCMEIGGPMRRGRTDVEEVFYLGDVDDSQAISSIELALDHGVNFFDTAPAYGAGKSEILIGKALRKKREAVVIATKFGKLVKPEENWYGSYKNPQEVIANIVKECEASLRRMQTDYIDLYQFHLHDFPRSLAPEVRETLEGLVQSGKIRHYGWSTDDPDRAREMIKGAHCAAIQYRLNVVDRAKEMLRLCDRSDQISIARSPLASGFLTGKYTKENFRTLLAHNDFRQRYGGEYSLILDKLEQIRAILYSGGRTLVQGALCWIWACSDRTVAIPGFRTLAQVEENISALDYGPLPEHYCSQIDEILGKT